MDNIIDKLLTITDGCRADMHEPDEQGISAHVVGYRLDNACGEYISDKAIIEGWQEYIVILHKDGRDERFNLASLIALARMGARTIQAETIFK